MSAPARTRAQMGKAAVDRSKRDERAVAGYLRACLYPEAERAVRTGFKAVGARGADPGDICNTPGLITSVKSWSDVQVVERMVLAWLDELDRMRSTEPNPVRLLVVRRFGKSSPADWWLFMRARQFAELAGPCPGHQTAPGLDFPVRMYLREIVPVLLHQGIGVAA